MKVHFIAIGGSVMHQLAIALKKKGYEISGSDDEIFEPARTNLSNTGILPEQEGWFPSKINSELDAVILGMHAREDNPELIAARQIKIPVYSFPQYIFEESRQKKRIVVGGSHGKTTTTAMIMHVMKYAGKDFDYLVGARLDGFEQSVKISNAPLIVCEGDEYPASVLDKRPKFHFLHPHIAILTGIAWDHINVFPTFDLYLEQFRIFLDKIEPDGSLIYNQTDPVLKDLVEKHPSSLNKIPYRIPQHEIKNGETIITLEKNSSAIKVFGNHNLLNLQAAWIACKEAGLDAVTFINAISSFSGASKRLELLGKNNLTNVYRDFAHAPSKVKATIQALKQQFPSRKLIAVLELHTYSSLNQNFMNEYKGTMDEADEAVVFYSKHALEIKRMAELPKELVYSGFAKKDLEIFNRKEELEDWLLQRTYKNANLLLMSSGNFDGTDVTTFVSQITKSDHN